MLDNPFFNPNQIDSGQLKTIEAKLKSDLQSFISSEIFKLQQSLLNQIGTGQGLPKKELPENVPQEVVPSDEKTNVPQMQFNYIIDICLNGSPSKMAIAGQVLSQSEIDAL